MISLTVCGPLLELNAGYLHHDLVVSLGFVDKSILWTPIGIYAVYPKEKSFHLAQWDKQLRQAKHRVLWCNLLVNSAKEVTSGLYVPADDVYPFDGFARVDYEILHIAAQIVCRKHQPDADHSIKLWSTK